MKWQIYGENEKKGKYLEDENKSLFLFLSFSVICDLGYHLFKVMHSSLCSGHILVVSTPWSPPPSPEVVGGTGARRRPGYGGQTVAPSCGGRFNRGGTSVKSISETWGKKQKQFGKKSDVGNTGLEWHHILVIKGLSHRDGKVVRRMNVLLSCNSSEYY